MQKMEEIFKHIKGYENYQVSNMGRVKGIKKEFLKTKANKYGYHVVVLSKNGKLKHFKLHRLVALNFLEEIENKPFVDHINADKNDNRLYNLRFVTMKENNMNINNKINIWKRGTNGKLFSDKIILEIFHSQLSHRKIKEKYNVSFQYIHTIKTKQTRKYLFTNEL